MIDFDSLCLRPAMDLFARPIVVYPKVSKPGHASYDARGVWSSKPVDVSLLGDRLLSSQIVTLGVRNSEFSVMLAQGDEIDVPEHLSLPAVGRCLVDGIDSDGQGGSIISLKVKGS